MNETKELENKITALEQKKKQLKSTINNKNNKIDLLENERKKFVEKIKELNDQLESITNNFNRTIKESYEQRIEDEKRNRDLFNEQAKLKNQIETWQLVVDEIAHTIHTDLDIAAKTITKFDESDLRNKTFYHIIHVRDLVDLTMWFIKRDELLPEKEKKVRLNLPEILSKQIETVMDGYDSLRIPDEAHKKLIRKLSIVPIINGECKIITRKSLEKVFHLIFKDLLRNAFRNTNPVSPLISISLTELEDKIEFVLKNNKKMPENWKKWIEGDEGINPPEEKSQKVGLRIIKKWLQFLTIAVRVSINNDEDSTTFYLSIPKEIKIE